MLFLGYTSKLLPDGTEWRGGNKRRQHVEGPYPCKALLQQAITERILPGNNKAERLSSLWKRLKEFYKRVRPASVLDNLTEEMIRRDGPKLKANGAECQRGVGSLCRDDEKSKVYTICVHGL